MAGVEKLLALGAYPDVPLKRAREKRDEARRLVADGIDPSARRQAERSAAANTFKAVTDEWLVGSARWHVDAARLTRQPDPARRQRAGASRRCLPDSLAHRRWVTCLA